MNIDGAPGSEFAWVRELHDCLNGVVSSAEMVYIALWIGVQSDDNDYMNVPPKVWLRRWSQSFGVDLGYGEKPLRDARFGGKEI